MWSKALRALGSAALSLIPRGSAFRPTAGALRALGSAALALGVLAGAAADPAERHWEDDDHSHDRVRRAVERGDALPVGVVLERLRAQVPGEIMAMEYEHEYGRWVYEFKLIDPAGRLRKVHLDAATGELMEERDD
jgi:uncharacterized membrane protein YkoI